MPGVKIDFEAQLLNIAATIVWLAGFRLVYVLKCSCFYSMYQTINLFMFRHPPEPEDISIGGRFESDKAQLAAKAAEYGSLPSFHEQHAQNEQIVFSRIREVKEVPVQRPKYYSQRKINPQVAQTRGIKRVCGNNKCRICKKLKPLPDKKYLEYLNRQKQKPTLPPLPLAKPKQKEMEVYTEFQNSSVPRRRKKVQSVVQAQSDDYSYQVDYKPKYSQVHNKREVKFDTEPEEETPNKYVRLNGKLYEIIDEVEKPIEPVRKLKQSSVRNLLNPIIDSRTAWSNNQELKNKQREELNRAAEKYIKFQTMFWFQLQNPNESSLSNAKKQGKQIEKMTMYRLKDNPVSENQDLFKTIYQRQFSNDIEAQAAEEEQTEVYKIKFPALSEIESSITAYESLTGQIKIQVLKNSKNYSREYSDEVGKEFLYFGGFDHERKQRKGFGVLVTKKRILQGLWMRNSIIKGAELKAGSLYKGEFKKNLKHGEGTCKWLNGEQYMGQWQNGLRDGQGFWSSKNGRETYSGEWKGGKVYGYGQYYKKDISLYKGVFENFIKNGSGVEEFNNGDKFEGKYSHGWPSGFGSYTWECGLKYDGEFNKGEREGKGRLRMPHLFQLDGLFEKEKPHGICQLKLKNGDIFNGKYVFGEKYGYGKLQYGDRPYEDEGFWNHGILQEKVDLPSHLTYQYE